MKKWLLCLIAAIAFLLFISVWWLNKEMQKQLNRPLALSTESILIINSGQSLKSLSKEIVKKGWLPHAYYFIYEGRRQDIASVLKAGEYTISVGTTPLRLLEILVEGKVKQYSMTIPEGWTFRQIIEAIKADTQLVNTLSSFTSATIMAELNISENTIEGRCFPDTYLFPAGTSDLDFLRRCVQTLDNVLAEEWQKREPDLPYQSAYEALTMASIIEKETARAEERRDIAGVFVRRLKLNMKLQTDPTVIYAMAENFDGDIRRKDLSIDSPYNTYRYKGLPPTPIASPGREAIYAALHPQVGTALYFVAKGDGSHQFSDTLSEHNKAVAKYQLKKR